MKMRMVITTARTDMETGFISYMWAEKGIETDNDG